MSTPAQIVIIINDGGVIESIFTTGEPAEVLVVNYDVDEYDGDDVLTLDEDGPAQCGIWSADGSGGQDRWARRAFEEAKAANL